MKYSSTLAMAALVGSAVAAREERTFAVMRFTNKGLVTGRMDPIVNPGETSTHVHTVMGGSGFSINSKGEDLINSKCTNAEIEGDFSNYWFPTVYFKDPQSGDFTSVDVSYVNVYYFFEKTQDEIEPFPLGLSMLVGNPFQREPPSAGAESNLDAGNGDIAGIHFTCPRLNNNFDNPPSWPLDSDGSMAGMRSANNKGEGVGFPSLNCDGEHSPLRADLHFPSCYDPSKGLYDYKNNMAFPTSEDGYMNCPEGNIHVPHMFLEVYWDTAAFADKWDSTSGTGEQPFVFANGDATGYGSHADFMSGWDEDLLKNIIDNCDAQHAGFAQCPGTVKNEVDCTIEPHLDEKVTGTMPSLPGNNPVTGWSYGGDAGSPGNGGGDDDTPDTPAPSSSAGLPGLPDLEEPTNVVENPIDPVSSTAPAKTDDAAEEDVVEEEPTDVVEEPAAPTTKTKTTCELKTVWETVTVTGPAPTPDSPARRHLHEHGHMHHRRGAHHH